MDEKLNKEDIWSKCLLFIKNRIQETAFQTWFDGVQVASINNEDITLLVPNRFHFEWLESKYRNLIDEAIKKVLSKSLIIKESAICILNGILWSSVVAFLTYLWFGRIDLGFIIAAALMINLIIGAISGVSLPLILTKLNIDPALAGGVILTTITDVIGFISLLGIATLMV